MAASAGPRGEGRDHLVHVGVAHRPAGDPTQAELVRDPGVLPVDGIQAVHDPRADQDQAPGSNLTADWAESNGSDGPAATARAGSAVNTRGGECVVASKQAGFRQ